MEIINFNYLKEKARMVKADPFGYCTIECTDCPLCSTKTHTNMSCSCFEMSYPDEAMRIVFEWAKNNPAKTRLTEFMKAFPNCQVNDDGYPIIDICMLDAEEKEGCMNHGCASHMKYYWNKEIE